MVLIISVFIPIRSYNTILLFYGKGSRPIEVTRPELTVVILAPDSHLVPTEKAEPRSRPVKFNTEWFSLPVWPASSPYVPRSSQELPATTYFYPARSLTPQFVPAFLISKGFGGLLASHPPWAATIHACSQVSF